MSVAATVVGVAGASTRLGRILTAGTAPLLGGSVSMALGDYVSISSQRDSQMAVIDSKEMQLQAAPDRAVARLADFYQ